MFLQFSDLVFCLFAASKNSLSNLTLPVPDSVSLTGYMYPTSSIHLGLNL